jgi:hypothetical protein
VGAEDLFKSGCPVCGYSAKKNAPAELYEKKTAAGPLPLWVYVLTLLGLIAVLAALHFTAL